MALFAFGSNGKGQLGVGDEEDKDKPTRCLLSSSQIPSHKFPMKVAAGANHTLVLQNGTLHFAGSNECGQGWPTGNKPESPSTFTALELLENACLVTATTDATIFVTESGEIKSMGRGRKGELGLGFLNGSTTTASSINRFFEPPIPAGVGFVDLASSLDHVVAVLSNGEVYGWGNGRKGQLGTRCQRAFGMVNSPMKIEEVDIPVARAVCGNGFTFLVGNSKEGRYQLLGTDKFKLRSDAPSSVVDWKDIGASWGSIFVLKYSGDIVSWGRSDRGQLAPRDLPDIEQMAIGSEHALALTSSGKVLCWGWGEHGNCGPDLDPTKKYQAHEITVPRKQEVESLEGPYVSYNSEDPISCKHVIGLGAGWATSFVRTTP